MSDAIALRHRPGEIEIAVVAGGTLADYALWRPGAPDGFGDLHRGRVRARAAALGGCFVALDGEPDGFLPDREAGAAADAPPPAEGTLLGVRVIRAALGGKGARLSARLDPEERALAATGAMRRLARGPSPLAELQARHRGLETIAADPYLAASCGARLVAPAGLVSAEADIEDAIAALRESALALPGGARATIHPTPALVAIDVDTAQAGGSRRTPRQTAQFAANRAVLPALLGAIRLRNLSGAIVIDLAGLAARKRAALGPAIEAALAEDPLRPKLLGFSALGFAEIVRVRQRPPLHELLGSPHGAAIDAAAAWMVRAVPAGTAPVARPALAPAVARAWQDDGVLRADLLREAGRTPDIRIDPALPPCGWRLEEPAP